MELFFKKKQYPARESIVPSLLNGVCAFMMASTGPLKLPSDCSLHIPPPPPPPMALPGPGTTCISLVMSSDSSLSSFCRCCRSTCRNWDQSALESLSLTCQTSGKSPAETSYSSWIWAKMESSLSISSFFLRSRPENQHAITRTLKTWKNYRTELVSSLPAPR